VIGPPPGSAGSPGPGGLAQRVVLVRHGETEWSRTGRHTGRTDLPLDREGEAQARLLGPRLAEWKFAEVLYSPLQRARRTCELAGLMVGARPDPDMQEWAYGAYEGRTADEIRAERPGWVIWKDGVVGGETLAGCRPLCPRALPAHPDGALVRPPRSHRGVPGTLPGGGVRPRVRAGAPRHLALERHLPPHWREALKLLSQSMSRVASSSPTK
jgi:probable phosphoglycerate mutase